VLQLQIEVTNRCNAACVFCSYPRMERSKGMQSLALTRKILDEAATIPLIDHITFTGLGETLLDKHLEDRVAYARAVLPRAVIDVFTNGSPLTPQRFDQLRDAGLTTLYVSLNAVRASQRHAIMQVDDFDRVVEVTKYAIAHGQGHCQVVVKGVASKDLLENEDGETFRQTWGGWTQDGGHAFLHLEGNWAGKLFPMRVQPTQACLRALTQIMVLWDGRVSLCCFDGEGEEILGDLNTQTLRDIYNGGRALEIRRAHAEGHRAHIPLCANCTSI